jgi:hypothetical protein
MLATLAGILLAVLIVVAGRLAWRLLCRIGALLRAWPRGPRRPGRRGAQLRGLRLRRSRAMLRAEGERSAKLTAEVRRLRAELALARAQRDAALARGGAAQVPGHDLFQEAKREFARRFHPDRLPAGAPDRALRTAIFRDFWHVLRRIERRR